ncbi:MAG: class I SAM-dependent methyltransferase [Deltaproteobacteria bacterium]|nr:class I SAM-dependent methyltransferase [Deltaproteobacteria bacterium]
MEARQEFYDFEYYLSLEYRYFSRSHRGRVSSLLNFLGDISNKSILDFGGGAGHLAYFMSQRGAKVTVADYSKAALTFGAARFPTLSFVEADYKNLSSIKEEYPIITCFDVIEHLAEPQLLLANLAQCLEAGGKLYISTDNEMSPFATNHLLKRLDNYWRCLSGEGRDYALIKKVESYRRSILNKDYHQSHVQEFSPTRLKELLEQNGWQTDMFIGYHLWSNPLKNLITKLLGKESATAFAYCCSRR